MEIEKVIVDGDWGGDEMQLVTILLGHPEKIQILGATAVFGNAPLAQVTANAGRILHLLNGDSVPYYIGAAGPTGALAMEGDGAHGDDGVGGTALPDPLHGPEAQSAVDFILETLAREPAGTVTITATGPQTNIAQAFEKDPQTMRRVKSIHIMGGCTSSMPARDRAERCGNITPFAEFNFFMAAADAHKVLTSGLPIVLFPMNCTHQLTYTPARQAQLAQALKPWPQQTAQIHGMIDAPLPLDQGKFGSASIMHDIHTAFALVTSGAYEGRRGFVRVDSEGETMGQSHLTPDPAGPVMVMETIKDPDALYDLFVASLQNCLSRHQA